MASANTGTYRGTYIFTAFAIFGMTCCTSTYQDTMDKLDFVYVDQVVEDPLYEIRYAGENNFMGRQVEGYEASEAILTRKAAQALREVQDELRAQGLGIKIFDAYRPQRAVDHFVRWAQDPSDTVNKRAYYPNVPKDSLFHYGYIAEKSGHTRGSTVDLTLVDRETGAELDMGGSYDFFGKASHHDYVGITAEQKHNRALLRSVMGRHGFTAYPREWWHYTLEDEPYPERYFSFPVRSP